MFSNDNKKNINWKDVEIQWHSIKPNIPEIEYTILKDCNDNLKGLKKVSDLQFHCIFLNNDREHNVVVVWGQEENELLHCEFNEKVNWVKLNKIV
jgi:hypothetical protein